MIDPLMMPLHPASVQWDREYRDLIGNQWLKHKTERRRRIEDKIAYLHEHVPEILKEKGLVIDLGPGPGEFLEVCRLIGHQILGIDAKNGYGGMGDDYLKLSKLMAERQEIPIEYCGVGAWLAREFEDQAILINAQGSFEQIFAEHMAGPPHHECRDTSRLRWKLTESLTADLLLFFKGMHARLQNKGLLAIWMNGAANHTSLEELVVGIADSVGLKLLVRENKFLKWRKS